jgi:hypothetical protein
MKKYILFISVCFIIISCSSFKAKHENNVILIDGNAYNTDKLKNINRQREAAYNELYLSLYDELYGIIKNLYIGSADEEYPGIQGVLDAFYAKSKDIDEFFYQLMAEYNAEISLPPQNEKPSKLDEIFPAYINVIQYNGRFYNEFALKVFMEQHESIIGEIIKIKTNGIMEYIDYHSYSYVDGVLPINTFKSKEDKHKITNERFLNYYLNQCVITNNILDEINFSIVNISDNSFFNIPVILIDNIYYDAYAINELQKSMKIVSAYLIENTKRIMIRGVNNQTEIYIKNIDVYSDWLYSYLTSIGKTWEKIKGFITGNKTAEERYYSENFNRIMNSNTDFSLIIEKDLNKQNRIISGIYYEYFNLKGYFSVNTGYKKVNTITNDDFIAPFIGDIVSYYDQIFASVDNANNNYLHENKLNDNRIKNAITSGKYLLDTGFIEKSLINYPLINQELLSKDQLKRHIINSIIESQNNKIFIIRNPFNYLFYKLNIGSLLYVDNYFINYNAYQHYGVYIGNGKVIHFAPLEGHDISFKNAVIHETTLSDFLKGRPLQIDTRSIEKKFPGDEIVKRARSRLGRKNYNLLTNNCEHFARWSATGEHVSFQVSNRPVNNNTGSTAVNSENEYRNGKFTELFNLLF